MIHKLPQSFTAFLHFDQCLTCRAITMKTCKGPSLLQAVQKAMPDSIFPVCPFSSPRSVWRCPDSFWDCPLQTLSSVMHILDKVYHGQSRNVSGHHSSFLRIRWIGPRADKEKKKHAVPFACLTSWGIRTCKRKFVLEQNL
jgi:hypothetical protein